MEKPPESRLQPGLAAPQSRRNLPMSFQKVCAGSLLRMESASGFRQMEPVPQIVKHP